MRSQKQEEGWNVYCREKCRVEPWKGGKGASRFGRWVPNPGRGFWSYSFCVRRTSPDVFFFFVFFFWICCSLCWFTIVIFLVICFSCNFFLFVVFVICSCDVHSDFLPFNQATKLSNIPFNDLHDKWENKASAPKNRSVIFLWLKQTLTSSDQRYRIETLLKSIRTSSVVNELHKLLTNPSWTMEPARCQVSISDCGYEWGKCPLSGFRTGTRHVSDNSHEYARKLMAAPQTEEQMREDILVIENRISE